ncbi:hypothetical protein [Fictibacillus phosphorivorans]|uniref:hypothetical protein n=1 Tax=Fictibacillus phosphorivorans TaxID=1221500 RepID=UPI0012933627|nr:hypothetical protein [Fictibacillus phosphorivorans]
MSLRFRLLGYSLLVVKVIPFLKLAYQKKNAGIITLFLFLILYLLTMSIIPFIGAVTQ